jgi:hypothetical protein
MSEFDDLTTYEEFKAKLGSLLNEAAKLAKDDAMSKRSALAERFIQFQEASYPNTPEIKRLDQIAEGARQDVLLSGIEARVAAISARNSEYATLEKRFGDGAVALRRSAASIRLEQLTGVTKALSEAITAASLLAKDAEDADDPAFRKALNKALDSLVELRTKFEDLAGT